MSAAATARRGIPEASVARLPGYLRALTSLARDGIASVSSEELAARRRRQLGDAAQGPVATSGSYGVRGVGYDVERLASEITSALGLTQDWPVAIVGMGNLGRALAAYRGFAERGFRVIALLDGDPRVVGERVSGQQVRPMGDLAGARRRRRPGHRGHRHARPRVPSRPATTSSPPGCARCSTSRPPCSRCPTASSCARSTCSTELQILAFHGQKVAVAEVVSS